MDFERPECYICRASPENPLRDFIARWDLISPCSCNGSIAHVHRYCLEDWLLTQAEPSSKCGICKSDYVLEFTCTTRILIALRACMHVLAVCLALTLSIFLTWIMQTVLDAHDGSGAWAVAMAFIALAIYAPLLAFLQCLYRDFRKMKRIADSRAVCARWLDENVFHIDASD